MAKLYFRYSAMNAGKSTALLQVAHNYEEHGRKVRIFTAEIDNRFGKGIVTSRLGPQRNVETFNEATEFTKALGDVHDLSCLLVDEAQFLTVEQVRDLHRIAHVSNVPVICYGLRSDFLGNAFPGSALLLTLADSIEEIKTICACGRKATMNVRIDETGKRITQGSQIAIEGETRYIQTCGRCFYNP
ncbi:MAG TPA: thymidine kinase [Candidatus Rubrimentiphilum sp.]|nr:thymidine kinase [Candidatus Rubrimentiphilum sp.]